MAPQPVDLPLRPADHPAFAAPRLGVLLVNLGTPGAPTAAAVRRYLAEFLSDPRVVELPSWLWQPVLRGIVLRTRPGKSARAYAEIWQRDGSPLAVITARQAQDLGKRLGEGIMVAHAMRYGAPAIAPTLSTLRQAGCRRILVAPLYPQYCAATTASVQDAVFTAMMDERWQPSLRFLPPYFDDPHYIEALATAIEADIATLDFVPDAVLASFHGMPARTLAMGDPYHCQCVATARLLTARLGRRVILSFQSRFGRAKWLDPATDATLDRLGREGIRRLAVVAPGFAADCLETLEEVALRGRATFLAAGGTSFAYLPCLNDRPQGMAMLEALIRRELGGWL